MSFLIVDILKLQPGRTIEEAIAYFEELKPVLESHGIRRFDRPLGVQKFLRGDASADLVNLLETDNPEQSLKGMASDPAYQQKVPERDKLFDLENSMIALTLRK